MLYYTIILFTHVSQFLLEAKASSSQVTIRLTVGSEWRDSTRYGHPSLEPLSENITNHS